MIKNKRLLIILTTLLLAAIACSGGTGGSVSGTQQSCNSSGGSGTCDARINKLSGTFTHKVDTGFYNQGDPVFMEVDVTVQTGQMKMTIESPDGFVTSIEVNPGTTNKLTGISTVDYSMDEKFIPLTLEALDGDVEGIEFTIAFSQP